MKKNLNIAIDASSIVNTGGFTHLSNLIKNFDKEYFPQINKIVIFGSNSVLMKLPNIPVIRKKPNFFLNNGIFSRLFFQLTLLDIFLRKEKIDILLSCGGDYLGSFRPYVGISQNMLLYEKKFWKEIKSIKEKLKLWINYKRQEKCFKSASGIIFISKYAKKFVTNELEIADIPNKVVHHGVSSLFITKKKENFKSQNRINRNFKFIYVSTVHVYKNQWNVIEAIWKLRKSGIKISLTLVGPIIYPPSGIKLYTKMKEKDPDGKFIKYIPEVPHEKLPKYYSSHDAVIYASSCENMPNILIESMASGLPIACSDKEPMPEFLKTGGYYFDADSIDSIMQAVIKLLKDKNPTKKTNQNIAEVEKLKWVETSKKTFSFMINLI